MQNPLNVVRTAHWQTGIVSPKILSSGLKLTLHKKPKKTYAECAAKQPDTSIKPTCNPAPAKDHIFSTAGKKTTNKANTTKPCSTSTGMDSQKTEHDQSGQL